MAEEKKKGKAVAKTAAKVVLGVVFVVLGILAIVLWWSDLLTVIKGCIGVFAVLAGAITIAIAKD